ncbi:protein ENL-like [Panicum virgatum]|uniref:protein ENL-like n=1 Tax=Panicum virgatum TaxID=38727 RepID=UPI0019D699AA|nr:protein ENL-like [Panicum virgatum]
MLGRKVRLPPPAPAQHPAAPAVSPGRRRGEETWAKPSRITKTKLIGGEFVLAPKAGYDGVRERAIPSPSSVLDADLTLSPSSLPLLPPPPPPPPPPFLGRERRSLRKPKARSFNEFGEIGNRSTNERLGLHGIDCKQFRSKSAVRATRSAFAGYDPVKARSAATWLRDGDIKEDENIFEEDEEVAEEEDGSSCDEELFELATKPGPEVEEEAEEDEEEEFVLAPKAGYDGIRERAIPSPSSVLDADLTLSPSSPPLLPPPPPPPPPPFLQE